MAASFRTLVATLLLAAATPLVFADEPVAQEPARNPLQLPTLIVDTPEDGFRLALKLARLGVSQTQHDRDVLRTGREAYATDPAQLIQASQAVAIHFQTVAQANNYWRD